ncbi:MAG TPA: hypothetical protein VF268_05760 [Gammaproteobacteria bacterium]
MAAENLTVNGFFDDKAILTVDGKPTIFTVGESRGGVTLLETGQDYALVRVGGKNKMLFMDQAIPKHLVDPQAYQQNSTAKSHIIATRLLHQTDNTATFAVEYFFNADEAEYAALSAKTRFRGKITPYWTYTVTSLKPGRHTTTITVGMSEDAPASYISDAVYFDIMPVTGAKVIEFVKEWKRATESTERHGKIQNLINHREHREARSN